MILEFLSLSLMINRIFSLTCFDEAKLFPKFLGTDNGQAQDTVFFAMDVDDDLNIIAGGYSLDSNIVSSSVYTPILVYY